MSTCSCRYKCTCIIAALIAAIIIGVIASFLQITAAITITPAFLWTLFGIGVGLLAVLLLATSEMHNAHVGWCQCTTLNAVLIGLLGTVLFAVVLLGVGIVATSVTSAVLVGLLLFSFSFALSTLACHIRAIANCGD